MKRKVFTSDFTEYHVGRKFDKILEKHGYLLIPNRDIFRKEKILFTTSNGEEKEIDPSCGGLNPDDSALLHVSKKLKRLFCLAQIDKAIEQKELLKEMKALNKAYLYMQIKGKKDFLSEFFTTIDDVKFYPNPSSLKTLKKMLSKKFTTQEVLECFFETECCHWYADETKSEEDNFSCLNDIVLSRPKMSKKEKSEKMDTVLDELFPSIGMSSEEKYQYEYLLSHSISLNYKEKVRIVDALPTLSRFQIDSLIEVWKEEEEKFDELNEGNPSEIIKLKRDAKYIWPNIQKYVRSLESSSPKKIASNLKKIIIGQDDTIKALSTMLYYHQEMHTSESTSLQPMGPVLLAGPTGVGKTLIVKESAKLINVPYVHIDCSSMVSEGIVGLGINDVLKDILRASDYDDTLAKSAIVFFDEFDKLLLNHSGTSILTQILRVIEGHNVSITKSVSDHEEFKDNKVLDTSQMLFIFGGSFEHVLEEKRQGSSGFLAQERADERLGFSDLSASGFPRELLGRIKKILFLDTLKESDFYSILKESQESPIKYLNTMLKTTHDLKIEVSDDVMQEMAKEAAASDYGARRLQQLSYALFEDILYEAPTLGIKEYYIDTQRLHVMHDTMLK